MFLAVDIGNSSISFGIFDKDNLIHKTRLPADKHYSWEMYSNKIKTILKPYKIDNCMIASVLEELTQVIRKAVDNAFGIESVLFTTSLKLNAEIKTESPSEVGVDRLANVVAAKSLFRPPVIVVDSGTATTFDIVDNDGNFSGGLIMPGLNTQMKSLNVNTSKLPLIKPDFISKVIAINTTDSILSGVVRGHACAIEGLIKLCIQEMGTKPTIVATGGQSPLISEYVDFDSINPNLTLLGIKIVYDLNY